MDPLSARHGIEEGQQTKARLEKHLESLPIERKLEMIQLLIEVARDAGTLPDWYYNLMEIPKPKKQ
jgi:hypothetical protein